ncbi:MAG: type II secretion system F family protein [Spirochaetia bacterium]|nr:type II secretion system F family protein [Spirochaetia bacterium]
MAIFRYVGLNRKGKEEKGIVDAGNAASARRILKGKGLYVKLLTEDTEKKDRALFPFLTNILYRVPRRDVGLVARQLGTLLSAGLPLDKSLANIIDQTENIYLKKALIEIKGAVVGGASLGDAMEKHPAIFPPLYHNLVRVGEKTGTYEMALVSLADLEDANQALKNKMTTAMFYPIIMLFLLGAIMVFLLAVVFPQIQTLFVQLNAELPLITRIVMGVSDIVSSWKIVIPMIVGAVSYYFFQRWKATPDGRMRLEGFVLKQPLIGSLVRKAILARFSRNLGVMLKSRVDLIVALQVVARVVDHSIFAKEIEEAIAKIKEGSKMTEALRDSVIVTQMVFGMLAAGEISDQVPEMVLKIADVMDDDVEASVQKFSSMLEPAMMVVMGFVIIVMMTAIMLPMFNLTKQMQLQ